MKLLLGWAKQEPRHMSAVSIIWTKPKDHVSDCYFCLTQPKALEPIPNTLPSIQICLRPTDPFYIVPNSLCQSLQIDQKIKSLLRNLFQVSTMNYLKKEIFVGRQIRQLINELNESFEENLNNREKLACKCFVNVVRNFLGTHKSENYKNLINNVI